MSGIHVSKRRDAEHRFLRRRGPQRTRTLTSGGYHFTHYLSAVAAESAAPGLDEGDLVCLWDGTFFDRPAEKETGAFLAAKYRRHGEDFAGRLDGEFAVVVVDFERRILLAATDAFGTRPLFLAGAEASSYASALADAEGPVRRVPPNTLAVVGLDGGAGRSHIVAPFDFDHQHKDTYDDWIRAFEQAVAQRAVDRCYLPLSAGYDSGGIDCALSRLGLPYKAYSLRGREHVDLLRRRCRPDNQGEILSMDEEIFAERTEFLRAHCEPARFHVTIFDGTEEDYDVHDDRASRGLALIHARARAEDRRVFLSGHGVDETLAANRHWPGARFPEVLRPWPDFDGNWQSAYLAKEELVAGACGVEGRFPFLDRQVVQEFLWLSAELKSRRYKAPLEQYLRRCDYPFDEDVKTGFNPLPED